MLAPNWAESLDEPKMREFLSQEQQRRLDGDPNAYVESFTFVTFDLEDLEEVHLPLSHLKLGLLDDISLVFVQEHIFLQFVEEIKFSNLPNYRNPDLANDQQVYGVEENYLDVVSSSSLI